MFFRNVKVGKVLPVLVLIACNTMQSGSNGSEEPAYQPYVAYQEWIGQTVKIVHLGLTDCALSIREGAPDQTQGNDATCDKSELDRARELVSYSAWQSYVGLTYDELHGMGAVAAGGGAHSDGGGTVSPPPQEESECDDADCPPESPGQSDGAPSGGLGVDGSVSIRTEAGTKVFWASSTGPEQDAIGFFRTLHVKYRRL